MSLDRIALIELLAIALSLNAAVIVLALRSRWVPHPAASDSSPATCSADRPDPTPVLPLSPLGDPVDLVEVARRSAVAIVADPNGPWSDGDREVWSDRIRAESARTRRYGRPAAVVALRLDGLDALSAEAGPSVSAWLSGAVVRNVRAAARESDVVQSDGHAAIRVLLVETDEEGARIYVERVSRPLMYALKDPRAEIRLSAGWAGTSSESDLDASDRLAHARLDGTSAGWIRSVATWRS